MNAMEDQQHSSTYDQARDAFNHLGLDDRVSFLISESINTVAAAVVKVAESVQSSCADIFGNDRHGDDPPEAAPESESASESAEA